MVPWLCASMEKFRPCSSSMRRPCARYLGRTRTCARRAAWDSKNCRSTPCPSWARAHRNPVEQGVEEAMPKVLVADDSITVRKVAERLLIEAGMEVALAASGEEAMAYLSTERPDFVISDVIMPDKSGYDVCRFVRSHSALASTPVLLISGIV